jgi:NAD-dependent deacetylase
MDTRINQLQQFVDESTKIVFFGGAGVSTESGIPDFRSQDGLYSQSYDYPPETILSRSFFNEHPEEFYEFYWDRVVHADAKPNAAHHKLAELEQAGKLTSVITQNIDGLHQAAGNRNVLELHGSVWRNQCIRCEKKYSLPDIIGQIPPYCDTCGDIIEPDVVLYEDPLNYPILESAVAEIGRADLLIIGGTSLVVYPAAGLIDYFRGNRLVVINLGETGRHTASLQIPLPIGEVLSEIVVS